MKKIGKNKKKLSISKKINIVIMVTLSIVKGLKIFRHKLMINNVELNKCPYPVTPQVLHI